MAPPPQAELRVALGSLSHLSILSRLPATARVHHGQWEVDDIQAANTDDATPAHRLSGVHGWNACTILLITRTSGVPTIPWQLTLSVPHPGHNIILAHSTVTMAMAPLQYTFAF